MAVSSASPSGKQLEALLKDYEKSYKTLSKTKERTKNRADVLFSEAVNNEKKKLLLEKRLAELDEKIDEYTSLEESQADLAKRLEKRTEEACKGLLEVETSLNRLLGERFSEESKSSVADICSVLVEKMNSCRFHQASEVETTLVKEKDGLDGHLNAKRTTVNDLRGRLDDTNDDLKRIQFLDIDAKTKSDLLNGLRKRNRSLGLKSLHIQLEISKLNTQRLLDS